MQNFMTALNAAKSIMETPLTIGGFTLNFWGIFIWTCIAAIVIWLIFRLLGD